MILSIYYDTLVLVIKSDMVSFDELILRIDDILQALVSRGSLELSENISEEQGQWFFLVSLEEIFLKDGLETNCGICIQVGEFLDIEFLDSMEAIKLFFIVN